MKQFFIRHRQYIYLFLIFALAEFLVQPLGDFALNDDWSYAKSVKILVETGTVRIGDWTSASLFTHLLWGSLFAKCFGFSFTVLRFSVLVLSLATVLLIYWFARRSGQTARAALLVASLFLFNPLFFNLSNTFMTDVTFVFLLLVFFLLTEHFFETRSSRSFVLMCLVAVLIILTRQYGLICSLSFLAVAILTKAERYKNIGLALILLVLQGLALRLFEMHVSTYIVPWSPYQMSGTVKFTERAFLLKLWEVFSMKYHLVILQVLFFAGPLAMLYLKHLWRRSGAFVFLMILSLAFYIVWHLMGEQGFITGNIIDNMVVGPEIYSSNWRGHPIHNQWDGFMPVVQVLGYIFCTVSAAAFISPLLLWLLNIRHAKTDRFLLLCVVAFMAYFSLLWLNVYSLFDRYQLPLILLSQLMLFRIYGNRETSLTLSVAPLLLFIYVSVAGARDYLELHRVSADAYRVIRDMGVPADRINGGYELSCWKDGAPGWLKDVATLNNYNYLIQFTPEKDFTPVMSFAFTRYYPYRQDKIYIFARDQRQKTDTTAAR